MKHLISICAIGLFFCQNIYGQNKFWDKVTVRKNYESKTEDDSKPAIFSFTLPKDTTSSWLFNGGIGFDFIQHIHGDANKNSMTGITGFAVYNQNTLVEKKQKNYKVGLSMSNLFQKSTETSLSGLFGTSTLQYLHNHIDTTHTAIVTSYWNPIYKSASHIFIGGYGATNNLLTYYFLPQVGLEYQNIIDAKSTQKKGYDARVFFNTGLNIIIKKKSVFTEDEIQSNVTDFLAQDPIWSKKPLTEVTAHIKNILAHIDSFIAIKEIPKDVKQIPKTQWPKLLELSVSYTGRDAFISHNSNFEKFIPLFTAGINFYPLKTEDFSIGFSYNKGANPIDGTLKQTYWLFSIAFKK